MPNDERPLDSKHGISRDVIAWRLQTIEDNFKEFADEMRKEIKDLHSSFALQARGCPMAGQCENLVKDVKELQQERQKTRGVLLAVGTICTLIGWVVSTLPSWIK